MKNNNFLNALTILFALSILIAGCKQVEKEAAKIEREEFVDTGVLVIESMPSEAEVYVNDDLKGITPLTVYNFPVGTYKVTIKKQGYFIFEKTVNVAVGRTEEIDAELKQITPADVAAIDKTEIVDELAEDKTIPAAEINKIDLSSFAMYYDFENAQFTEIRTGKSDLFSRKYSTYVHFTALSPAKINVINRPIRDVQKEDCIFADAAVTSLFSGQTLCVKTAEGSIVAVGGSWQAAPTELEWVLLSPTKIN